MGSYLEVEEIRLALDVTLVDSGASISAMTAPSFGSIGNLIDGTTSRVYWPYSAVVGTGFWIKWGFASAVDANAIRFAEHDTPDRRLYAFTLERSDNDTDWINVGSVASTASFGQSVLSSPYYPMPPASAVATIAVGPWYSQSRGITQTKTPAQPSEVNLRDGGGYKITGTVKEKATPVNIPLRRRVRLHNQRTGDLVAETWSDATTGAYTFEGIAGGRKYYVVSFDHTLNHRAVIADNLTPEAM